MSRLGDKLQLRTEIKIQRRICPYTGRIGRMTVSCRGSNVARHYGQSSEPSSPQVACGDSADHYPHRAHRHIQRRHCHCSGFPAAAQAYAQASIPALGDGAVSNIPIPEDEPIAPSDSLDIRSLPLLDERSATLWEDPSNADTVGRTVFADQWDALMEAANSPISSLDIMPFTTVDNSTLDHVREIVAQRLDELLSLIHI